MENPLIIAIGKSRRDTRWRNVEMTWPDLVAKLGSTYRTRETMREYRAMSKEDQGKVKDIGGFVGGRLSDGHRKNENIVDRCLITLDADNATSWEEMIGLWMGEMVCYSTHSHTPEHPRFRFVIPLTRPVTPEEYPAVARKLAEWLNIEAMDPSTYEPARLMYWPSCPSDAEPFFQHVAGEIIDPDEILAEYGLGDAWKDTTLWPIAKSEQEVHVKEAKRQGDPTEKPGIVGLFCRAYDIETAMDELIPGVYEPAGENRFTFVAGTTAAGAVMYEDGKFLYSHHGTDPCGGQLVNAFDMVRIHKFGDRDVGLENQEITRRPSYNAMCEYAAGLDRVKKLRASELAFDLGDLAEESSDDWQTKLSVNSKTGMIEPTLENITLIMRHDPGLKGVMAINLLRNGPVMKRRAPWDNRKGEVSEGGEPWRDSDNSNLLLYMEKKWKITSRNNIQDAMVIVREENAFDPVQDYLTGLEWDGVERLDTMLVRWMGAEDNKYVRAVTRKWMCAAVARAMRPGCKFDNMLILVGKQGIGKSNLARALSRGWFTDSLGRMDASKDSYERLFGIWIAEVAELAATKKAEIEDIKNFISKQEDTFRKAYGKEDGVYRRHCVFYGSTNDQTFLRDATGGRRFWPVEVTGFDRGQLKGFEDEVDQLWAEAVVRWRQGEALWLDDDEVYRLAEEMQEAHTAVDDWTDDIQNYLDTLLPANWEDKDQQQRRSYFNLAEGFTGLSGREKGVTQRTRVSSAEIRWELFGWTAGRANSLESRRIASVMNNMPGWRRIKTTYRDKCYGVVRGWEREVT